MIKKLIYPNLCALCKKLIPEGHICNSCQTKLLESNYCPRCKKMVKEYECPHCESDIIIGLLRYEKGAKRAIARWKYTGVRKYGDVFAKEFSYKLDEEEIKNIDAFIPVPVSKNRLNRRGFNQAADLSQSLSKILGIKTLDILQRNRKTKAQSKCTIEERIENIANSINVIDQADDIFFVNNVNIAIVDDIYTTGSTIRECVKVLRQRYENIKKVYVFVVCIT